MGKSRSFYGKKPFFQIEKAVLSSRAIFFVNKNALKFAPIRFFD